MIGPAKPLLKIRKLPDLGEPTHWAWHLHERVFNATSTVGYTKFTPDLSRLYNYIRARFIAIMRKKARVRVKCLHSCPLSILISFRMPYSKAAGYTNILCLVKLSRYQRSGANSLRLTVITLMSSKGQNKIGSKGNQTKIATFRPSPSHI